jgi:hypothetical protein
MTKFKEHSEVARPAWLGAGWDDNSWHNDAMPHCTLHLGSQNPQIQPVVEIWVNYPRPEDREIGTAFEVVFMRDWSADSGDDVTLYSGEDEAAAVIWERAARTAKSMIAVILARPDLNACWTFSQLHDHCDANILGDVEAMTAEGEAHRVPSDDPEVGITGWAHRVHERAVQIVEAWMGGRK